MCQIAVGSHVEHSTLELQSRDMRFDQYMSHARALDFGRRQMYQTAVGSHVALATLERQSRDMRFDRYLSRARALDVGRRQVCSRSSRSSARARHAI